MATAVSPNGTADESFSWSKRSERAALLVAEDALTDQAIADDIGISKRTLERWKQHSDFMAKVDAHIGDFAARLRRRGLARLDKRMERYEDRHRRMTDLLEARARLLNDEIDGGSTGVQVRQLKSVTVRYEADPNDPDGKPTAVREEVYEYTFDAALMRELRELEKQISVEVGDWNRKLELAGSDGGPITITFAAAAEGPD